MHENKTLFFRRYQVDVSRKEQVEELANKIQSEVGDVNILVNNAGVLYCRPFVQWTPNQIEQVVQTNLMGKIDLLPSKSQIFSFLISLLEVNHQNLIFEFRSAVDAKNIPTKNDRNGQGYYCLSDFNCWICRGSKHGSIRCKQICS